MVPPLLSGWVVPIAAVVATSITVYKFWIQRPSLIVDAEVSDVTRTGRGASLDVELFVANVGRDFAEDGYVAFAPEGWSLDATPADGQLSLTAFEGGDGGTGKRKTFLDDIVYQGTGFELCEGRATVPGDGRYRLAYTTACQSQRPKTDHLELVVDGDEATVEAG
ncbi:hypothetical protein [Halostella litorea]|uniref:hypothetical protein n=1 Tax=Halostella litorea TaxID=2528831 RepID=UPI0010922B2D|nr:hypothetical protein [Halostella litorea]